MIFVLTPSDHSIFTLYLIIILLLTFMMTLLLFGLAFITNSYHSTFFKHSLAPALLTLSRTLIFPMSLSLSLIYSLPFGVSKSFN